MAVKKGSTSVSRSVAKSGYTRIAYETQLTQTAANALTVREIDLNLSLDAGEVVILHAADMSAGVATIADLRGQAGFVSFAIAGDTGITDTRLFSRVLYGFVSQDIGAIFTGNFLLPWKISWMLLPQGGLAVPPGPLCFAVDSANMTIPGVWNMRLLYTVVKVSPPQALDMLRSLIPQAF